MKIYDFSMLNFFVKKFNFFYAKYKKNYFVERRLLCTSCLCVLEGVHCAREMYRGCHATLRFLLAGVEKVFLSLFAAKYFSVLEIEN